MSYSSVCPNCLERMNSNLESLICSRCKTNNDETKSQKNIDVILNDKYDLISKADICSLLHEIDSYGYDKGLKRFLKNNPKLQNTLLDSKRADAIYHGVGQETKYCLEIGNGLGTITETLSHLYANVFGLEIVNEYTEFQKYRFKHSNILNVTLLQSDGINLPFKDNLFDLIVCNNGFQWLKKVYQQNICREMQISLLLELKRVLSNNGCIVLGFKNKFGLSVTNGNLDRQELPYKISIPHIVRLVGSKMRKEKNLYSIDTNLKGSLNSQTQYTLRGYQHLLTSQGFITGSHWVFPSHEQPFYTAKIQNIHSIKAWCKFIKSTYPKFYSVRLRYKIVIGLVDILPSKLTSFIVRELAPSYIFLCFKSQNIRTMDHLIERETKQHEFFTISDGNNLKYIACNKKGNLTKIIHLKRNFRVPIKAVHHDNRFPGIYASVSNEVLYYSDWIPGKEIDPSNHTHLKATLEWLVEFQSQTNFRKMTEEFIEGEINLILDDIDKIDEINRNACLTIIQNYKSYVLSQKIDITREHGDFWYANVLTNGQNIFVIDWEFYRENGDPLFDFSLFLINFYFYHGFHLTDIMEGNVVIPGIEVIESIMRNHFSFVPDMKTIIPYTILRFIIRKRIQIGKYDMDWLKYSEIIGIVK